MLDFLRAQLTDTKVFTKLWHFLHRTDLGYGLYTYDDEELHMYDAVIDAAMYQVLTTPNKTL